MSEWVNCMFTSLMEHSDGLSLLFSTPPGSMHPNSIRLEIETFPGSVVKHQEW